MSIFDRFRRRDYFWYVEHPAETDPVVDGLSARDLYRTQANLHAVISFLADSIAQLPLKVYERHDEASRTRNRDSVAAKLLYRPNKDQTEYEFFNSLMIEYLLYGEAIVMLLPDDSTSGYQLRLIPSEWVEKRDYEHAFAPSVLYVRSEKGRDLIKLTEDQFVIFKQYNPSSPSTYQSPIASLKQTLSEQVQAARFRTSLWKNGGRMNAYITRPANVTPWTPQARDAWVDAFRKGWSQGGSNQGSVPVLEDGMQINQFQFSSKEAQYAESVQLTREDVCAAYHINPSLVYHTGTQTYASAKDNARALYAECLGPLIQMLQQRLNAFLLPKINADENLYVEFDLDEKLKGSFEERASIMQSATGAPWMTRNEVRAEYNLPPVEGADDLIIPLNVLVGGQASPQDSSADSYANQYNSAAVEKKDAEVSKKADEGLEPQEEHHLEIDTEPSEKDTDRFKDVLEKFMKRQERVISTKLKAVTEWWDKERWDNELKEDLIPILMAVSETTGREIADRLSSAYYSENTEEYIALLAETRAQYINEATYNALLEAQETGESVSDTFAKRLLQVATLAYGLASVAREFGAKEAISQAEYQGVVREPRIVKIWHTGSNPRPTHAAMDGEEVGIDEAFSNGLQWPHSWGPVEEVAGCNCHVTVEITW